MDGRLLLCLVGVRREVYKKLPMCCPVVVRAPAVFSIERTFTASFILG